MKLLSMKKKDRSRAKLEIQINNLMSTNLGNLGMTQDLIIK